MNNICSKKCANPGSSSGSERWPTRTSIAHADFSVGEREGGGEGLGFVEGGEERTGRR